MVEQPENLPMTTRRGFLAALALFPLAAREAAAACRPTQPDQLGPFYVPDQPFQDDLCPSATGERLTISGRVLGMPDCRPLPGALVEVWQTDAKGEYTLVTGAKPDPGCLLRARLKSDGEGRYSFRTITPGVYPGRPAHIHYRVSAPGYRTLVTQLYFKNDPHLRRPTSLAIDLARGAGGHSGIFDLVLAAEN
jgi:protocatechuate 3,4-dioxygenase beta subunit